jgi:protein-disulfide isomerase
MHRPGRDYQNTERFLPVAGWKVGRSEREAMRLPALQTENIGLERFSRSRRSPESKASPLFGPLGLCTSAQRCYGSVSLWVARDFARARKDTIMNLKKMYPVIGLLASLSVLGATGCKKQPPKDKAGETKAATDKDGKTVEAKAEDEKLKGPCGEFAKKLCGEAGETSGTCTSAKATLEFLAPAACTAALKDFAVTSKALKDARAKCDELVEALCTGVGKQTETCKMVQEKTKEFPPDRCDMMLKQKDRVIEDLKKQEMQNQPLTPELQAAIAAKDAPSFGDENAKVTVVEFSDFECPFCSRAADVTKQLREKYNGKIRFVFRQFPLSFHKSAQGAAEAALAANAQGKFWQFHDKMFENQKKLDKDALADYAKQSGLNVSDFKAAVESNKYADAVKADVKLGEQVAVNGTPTMFVNGKRVANPTDFGAVAKMIDEALGS